MDLIGRGVIGHQRPLDTLDIQARCLSPFTLVCAPLPTRWRPQRAARGHYSQIPPGRAAGERQPLTLVVLGRGRWPFAAAIAFSLVAVIAQLLRAG